ncbi:hypothetical protein DL95DRAFT_115659 [Leptodontidium sp. 2 PMI_412]|nr:hypothetical protein DL95DRAFT_115659 [Leptodontidium sp. 2 PMI_412]
MPNPGSSMASRRTEKEKQCPYCPRTFTKEEHLNRHRRSHTGEKPFRCHKCDRRYSRSDVLARHLQTHPSEGTPPSQPPDRSSILPGTRTVIDATSLAQLDSEQSQALNYSDNHETHSSASNMWRHHHPNDTTRQETPGLPRLVEVSAGDEDISMLGNLTSRRDSQTAGDLTSINHTTDPRFSFKQIRNEESASRIGEGEVPHQISTHNGYTALSQGVQSDVELPPLPASLEVDRFAVDLSRLDADFGPFGYFNPGMMDLDYFGYNSPRSPVSTPRLNNDHCGNTQSLLSVERLQQVQQLWRGKRAAPGVLLIRSLWSKVIQYESDNLFSNPTTANTNQTEQVLDGSRQLRWGMDEDCRKRLIDFCTEIDNKIYREGLADLTPHLTPPGSHTEPVFERSPPGFLADGFPTKEALDASVDFFFQYFPMPFIHKATFNSRKTPGSLLFSMCLIGLAALYPESSKPFVLRYQKKLIRYCKSELTSIALLHCLPAQFFVSIASTLLVVYLGLGLWNYEAEECQSHMLCVQMLHIMEKHGLFSAHLGGDLATQLQAVPDDNENSWKAWARVECWKRMIQYALWLDAAYARLMGSAGVVNMDYVDVHLPCDTLLFEAGTFPKFLQAAKRGSKLVEARMDVRNLLATAPPSLDCTSMITLVGCLYLKGATARHRLRGGNDDLWGTQSCSPAEILARDPMGDTLVPSIILLAQKYGNLFQKKNTISLLGWNNLCIFLTVDLNLLEIALGRDGVAATYKATSLVRKWSRSASARRAILHASQIFEILSSSRLHGSTFARPDLLLFTSALVLSMYVFVMESKAEDQNTQAYELLQEVDWTAVEGEGMLYPPIANGMGYQSQDPAMTDAAREFIQHGGPISFAREDQLGGATAARKVLLNYMHLLDDLGRWRGSRCSQLLRAMSDFVTNESI